MLHHNAFITFEGGDGAGKSTQINALALILQRNGHEVLLIREPGGTQIGEQIRRILLDPANKDMTPQAELLLYEAARAQLVKELIKPALAAGKVVLCDRFYDSTVAYQGYGRDLSVDVIHRLNDFAVDGCHPDRTILLDLDVESALARASQFGSGDFSGGDRLELAGNDFHTRVHEAFLAMAAGSDRIRLVQTRKQYAETTLAVFEQVEDLFPDITRADVKAMLEDDHSYFFSGRRA